MSRTVPSEKTRNLAGMLVAREAAMADSGRENISPALRVSEKLRIPLSTLAGTTGFRSLLSRALTLAKIQSDSLSAVQVMPDGSLEGLREPDTAEAGAILVAHLLGLLGIFIGEHLTMQMVHDVWPDLPVDETGSRDHRST